MISILIIVFLEFLWYSFSIGGEFVSSSYRKIEVSELDYLILIFSASWFEIGKLYYDWSLRLTSIIDIATLSWLSIGIIVPTLSLIATLALLYVALNERATVVIVVYIIKNVITIIMELAFFGKKLLALKSESFQDQWIDILMFCVCGLLAPILFSLVSFSHYRFLVRRNLASKKLLRIYEEQQSTKTSQMKSSKKRRPRHGPKK